MREYCAEAATYGDQLLPFPHEPKRMIVILNPASNKKGAKETFEKYCEPILYLGGFLVEVVQTDSEGHARRYIEDLPKLPDAILVAGGDGTVSEAVTGLLRRESPETCPIGILPMGRSNSVAKRVFYSTTDPGFVDEVEGIANATISVVRGHVEKRDAVKIELIDTEDAPPKPIYAVGALEWGAFRDIRSKRDKYWYVGGLREYFAFLFNAFSGDVTWTCEAKVAYTDPCRGCQNCRQKVDSRPPNTRWWAKFVPRPKGPASGPDYSKIVNANCKTTHEMEIEPTELVLVSRNLETGESQCPQLKVKLSGHESGFSFLWNAWTRVWNQTELEPETVIDVRSLEIRPKNESTEEMATYYSIDSEDFEVKPVRISVVPDAFQMFVLRKS